MTLPRNLGTTLLAVWLVVFGVLTNSFIKINFEHSQDLLATLAIAAGVFLFRNR
jgi:hypothetical protein